MSNVQCLKHLPALLPFLIELGTIEHQLVVQVHEHLYAMCSGYEALVGGVVDFVVEHHLCGHRGAIDDVDTGAHAIADGLLPLDVHLHHRSVVAVTDITHVGKVEFLAKQFAGVLKVKHVGAVPDDVHGVDLGETDIEEF